MKIEVKPDDVAQYKTDDRGRIYLGSEYKNSTVEVAVVGVEEDNE